MNWYVIQTKPNAHMLAYKNLQRQGFEVFLPLIRKTSRVGQKFTNKTVPLFPSYLFIGTKLEQIPWKSINSTRGVAKAIFLNGIYRAIDNEIIENLKCRCDESAILKSMEDINAGDCVRIKRGPLTDFICNVEKIEDSHRAWVLIKNLKHNFQAKVSVSDLSSIG